MKSNAITVLDGMRNTSSDSPEKYNLLLLYKCIHSFSSPAFSSAENDSEMRVESSSYSRVPSSASKIAQSTKYPDRRNQRQREEEEDSDGGTCPFLIYFPWSPFAQWLRALRNPSCKSQSTINQVVFSNSSSCPPELTAMVA